MLREIWLVPPLAFARGGSSPTPCDAFDWSEPDLSAAGTGRTQVVSADTLIVDSKTGSVSLKPADPNNEVIFKDGEHIRPVCPFFELHGVWEVDGTEGTGAVTQDVLKACGMSAADLKWRVEFHNSKAWHVTQDEGDRVTAIVDVDGNNHEPQTLKGMSPWGVIRPLVLPNTNVPLGSIQLTRPNKAFPEFRLRFTPGSGKAYAPLDLHERLKQLEYPGKKAKKPDDMLDFVWDLLQLNNQWKGFSLPPDQCILNPRAAWPQFKLFTEMDVGGAVFEAFNRLESVKALLGDPSQLLRSLLGGDADDFDVRNLPPGLYARVTEQPNLMASLGMIDDFGDGVITCSLEGVGEAQARIVSGPPDFAPDRRPPVSLADGLADRTLRAEVRQPGWVLGRHAEQAELEVMDIVYRAFETMGLANIDATNDYFEIENVNRASREQPSADAKKVRERLWTVDTPVGGDRAAKMVLAYDAHWDNPLRLTALGVDAHRRNSASVFFRSLVLKYPDFMAKWIRVPAGPDRYYDRKMPGLMRGSDRMPLHLTRRQYDLLANWVNSVRTDAQAKKTDRRQDPKVST
ncbi:MAG TPA: hypothetical protein VGJ08_17110 [Rhizomicrobium sp.]|jgi:hypothetical protein